MQWDAGYTGICIGTCLTRKESGIVVLPKVRNLAEGLRAQFRTDSHLSVVGGLEIFQHLIGPSFKLRSQMTLGARPAMIIISRVPAQTDSSDGTMLAKRLLNPSRSFSRDRSGA